jgi:hypothetical protein
MCKELEKAGIGCEWKPSQGPEGTLIRGAADAGKISRRKNGRPLLIEIELRRGSPVTNVVKVWEWIMEGRFPPNVILVQAFSAYYPEKHRFRRQAEFIGREMRRALGRRVKYIPVSFKYRPGKYGKRGGGARRLHAQKLARTVLRRLRLE